MMKQPGASPHELLARMESLADPTRLRLLRLVERHELAVAELCDVVQLPQSTVSRHLKMLADQGWVRRRSQRTTNLYRMDTGELPSGARRLWLLARDQTEGWATLNQDQLRLSRRLEARRERAERFFAGAAAQWDRLRRELYGGSFGQAALLALLPGDWVVADLGCGTGALTAALAPHVRRVVGVDQSPAMLRAAERRTSAFDNVDLKPGRLEALPLPDESCDAALMVLALSYASDAPRALREATRILRPGGKAVIVDLLGHDHEDFRRRMGQQCLGYEPGELCRGLAEAGLASATCRPLPPEPGAKGPALFLAAAARPAILARPASRPALPLS
jgi:ArsR family transcriptional regulator